MRKNKRESKGFPPFNEDDCRVASNKQNSLWRKMASNEWIISLIPSDSTCIIRYRGKENQDFVEKPKLNDLNFRDLDL